MLPGYPGKSIEKGWRRCCRSSFTHLIGRPVEEGVQESLPRDTLIAVSTFLVEAKASESKVNLRWEINTQRATVSLPPDKHRAWANDLQNTRACPNRRAIANDELESTIGLLNHAACVVPNSRHFLGCLYRASERVKVHCRFVKLSESQWDDLCLWREFLDDALC